MKQRALQFVPSGRRAWKDPAAFFAKGENDQWKDVLGAAELALYRRAMAERIAPELADWLENGGEVGDVAAPASHQDSDSAQH